MPERPESLSAETMALAMQAEGVSTRLREELRAIVGLNRAYQRLFFGADGALSREGRTVLRDLIKASEFGCASLDVDNGSLQVLEGKRRLLLHVFGRFRLPEGRLSQLRKDLASTEDDDE
jgi:hypothetical protein